MTLDEIECESDLETLTVRQLKELLVRNYVDYKGCCEKPELLDRVRRLWRQHRSKPEGKLFSSYAESLLSLLTLDLGYNYGKYSPCCGLNLVCHLLIDRYYAKDDAD